MSSLYKIYEMSNVKCNQPGMSSKLEIVKKNKDTWVMEKGIFKSKMCHGSKDNVVEAIVYRVALQVGVPCAKALVVQYKGEIGCFSRYEIESLEGFIHLQDYFGISELNIVDFFKYIEHIKCNNIKNIYARAFQYMIFDYLVGQQDRHMENLAFIRNRDTLTFYPLYDNGLALYGNKSNSMYKDSLESGRFNSRMGTSEEIYSTLKDIRLKFNRFNLHRVINLEYLNENALRKIIEEEDRYNEIIVDRRYCMIKFIMARRNELLRL